jgi:hypothetical protein
VSQPLAEGQIWRPKAGGPPRQIMHLRVAPARSGKYPEGCIVVHWSTHDRECGRGACAVAAFRAWIRRTEATLP